MPIPTNRMKAISSKGPAKLPSREFNSSSRVAALRHFLDDGDGGICTELSNSSHIISKVRERLEARLPGRIRGLAVYATENAIVLSGQCSTFYTKQLAQHVAMGVLEYEQLVNNIDVLPAR